MSKEVIRPSLPAEAVRPNGIVPGTAPDPTDRYVLMSHEDYLALQQRFLLGQRIEFADIFEGTPVRGVFRGVICDVSVYVATDDGGAE